MSEPNIKGRISDVRKRIDDITDMADRLSDMLEDTTDTLVSVSSTLQSQSEQLDASEFAGLYTNYTRGIKIGDVVYYAQKQSASNECELCNGSGMVKAIVDIATTTNAKVRSVQCPDCHGKGRVGAGYNYVIQSGRVDGISVRFERNEHSRRMSVNESIMVGKRGGFTSKELHKNQTDCKKQVRELNEAIETNGSEKKKA